LGVGEAPSAVTSQLAKYIKYSEDEEAYTKQLPMITGTQAPLTTWSREFGTLRPIYPDPRTQMNARAPIGIFRSRDWNMEKPMPLNIIEPNVVTAPLPIVESVESRNMHQK
jgi:hypothetical protein